MVINNASTNWYHTGPYNTFDKFSNFLEWIARKHGITYERYDTLQWIPVDEQDKDWATISEAIDFQHIMDKYKDIVVSVTYHNKDKVLPYLFYVKHVDDYGGSCTLQ